MTVSEREVLQRKDFAQMSNAEIAPAKEAISRLVCRSRKCARGGLAPDPRGH